MQLWAINDEKLIPIENASLNLESRLEKWLEEDISLIGIDVLIIGKQVNTAYGGRIDLLAIDSDGRLVIIELKRNKTPRDIIAQCLDYGSWVKKLRYDDINDICKYYKNIEIDAAFKAFYDNTIPDELNTSYSIIIVAESLGDSTERIVQHLSEDFKVSINAVFFNVFKDNKNEYIGRSWLKDPEELDNTVMSKARKQPSGFKYVNTGIMDENDRSWDLNVKYGFISAGGGSRWINAIRKLHKNDKIFAYIKKKGYVGFGVVEEEAVLVKNFIYDDKRLTSVLTKSHSWCSDKDPSIDEWLARVKWIKVFKENDAKWFNGAFANQNVVCDIRDQDTVEYLIKEFELSNIVKEL